MTTSITAANMKASGEIAVSPFLSHSTQTLSESSTEKDVLKHRHTSESGQTYDTDHDSQPPRGHGAFETISDKSYYTPIERYEGKHRYDPNFEWEPKEEKKLVRKVNH